MIIENYTTNLYTLINNFYTRTEIESWFKDYELTDYLTSEQILSIASHGVWTKDKLASKIVDHYLMSQIGFETPALFRHYAKIHMKEIMEKYLPIIYSSSIEYDPLVNVDYTETFNRDITENIDGSHVTQDAINQSNQSSGSSNSSSNNSGNSLNIGSDTPMTNINKTDILAR